jgi:hypothetical protein
VRLSLQEVVGVLCLTCCRCLPPSAASAAACAAVKVRLAGGAALDVLQKLSYLVLPSQNAFSGVSSKSLDGAGNLHFRCGRYKHTVAAQRGAAGACTVAALWQESKQTSRDGDARPLHARLRGPCASCWCRQWVGLQPCRCAWQHGSCGSVG